MGETAEIEIPAEALERLRSAKTVFALAGAGLSAQSGIPTFREPGTGLWSQYTVSDFATPEAWRRNAPMVWSWYSHRRRLARRAEPNPGHLALAQLQRWLATRSAGFTLATQNVDGLSQRAGSGGVLELHGSLFRFRCAREGTPVAWDDPEDDDPAAFTRLDAGEVIEPPSCPRCAGLLRPDVVWFGESLPREPWAQAQAAASASDVCLVIGTSAQVFPAADLPRAARRNGAYLIEVNPERTNLTPRTDWAAQAPAGVALPALLHALEPSNLSADA